MFGLRSSALGLLFVSSLLGVVEGADSYCNQGSVCDGNVQEGAWCNESDVNCEKGCGGSWCMDMDKEMDMFPLPEEEKSAVSLRGTRELQSSMCGCSSCSSSVYNRDARGHRVRDRIEWVVANMGKSQSVACQMVCGDEFPEVCGRQCAPNQCMTGGGGGQCSDSPRQWHDSDGPDFNCAWYAQRGRCARHGNGYRNFGRTANEACCACGGGGNAPSPPSPRPPPPSPTPPSPSPPTGGNSMCGCSSCTSSVYNRNAGGHLVRERIEWTVANMGMSQNQACQMVCGDEFPDICGSQCASNQCNNGPSPPSPSPPSPSPPTGGGGGSLSVVTQNLFWWNLFNMQNGGNFFNVYKSLGLQDVYLFQECDDVNRVKNGLGFGNMQTKQFGHGLAIAWNAGRFTKLSDGMDWVGRDKEVNPNWSPDRFVTWARLQERSTGKTFLVANHHGPLHIDTGGLNGPEDVASRIDSAIRNGRRNGEVIILAGDMNVHANGRTLQSLARKGYKRHAGDWVDHIFTKSGLGSTPQVEIIRDTGSDHQGVKARWSSF